MDIIRAWKDEDYRMSLTPEDRARLPENPAGPVELTDADLTGAGAGAPALAITYSGSFCLCNTKSICTLCMWC